MTLPPSDSLQEPAALPIGMFDSGMGGLTVLHECLVQLPGEHFAYVGDTARFPYGEKSREELELFSRQITAFLETVPVKLIVVACYSATSAALPALQEQFETPIIGVVMPGARAAVETSRYRKIGVLATEATVASGAYPRAIHGLDSGAEVIQQACPGLVDFIEAGDVTSQELADAVRGFTEPLKAQRPDVVIMGCTHYPLIAPMLAALPGARRHAHQPGRGDRPGGGGHAAAAGPRAPGRRHGLLPLLHDRRRRAVPLDRRPVSADAAHARPRAAARATRRARRAVTSRFLVRAAVYAALYAVLTLAPGLNALAYGQVQFRVSEALMIFACFDPAAVLGLTVGTAIGNLGSPMMPVDTVFGALLTLAAAGIMYVIGPRVIALAAPVIVNAFGVAAMLALLLDLPYWASAVWVGIGEAAVLFTLGLALLLAVRRRRDLFGFTRPAV